LFIVGNGSLEFPEFVQLMYRLSTHAHGEGEDDEEAELRDVFGTFDKDGDGFITGVELRDVLMVGD
jgi:Ca2+-binding EF-hand superfamily protein